MKRKFTYLLTALALLAFLSPTTAWGGVKLADTQRITQKTAHETMLGVPDGGDVITRGNIVLNKDNITNINGSSGYAAYDGDHTIGNVTTVTTSNVMINGQKLQFKKSGGVLYNKTAMPGNITKITLSDNVSLTIYVGTSMNPTSTNVSSGSTITGNYTYFAVKNATNSALSTASITVEYSNGGTITFSNPSISVDEAAHNYETFSGTFSNIASPNFQVRYYDSDAANANVISEPYWIETYVYQDGGSSVSGYCVIAANDGSQRFAYFKVYSGTVESNLVTVTQAAHEGIPTTTTIEPNSGFDNDLNHTPNGGLLFATVTANNSPIQATVTWASSNTSVATVNENGLVTLVAVGQTDITATYAGDNTYAGSVGTYQLNVINSAPWATATPGTLNNFSYNEGYGPSAVQTISVEGDNLASNVLVELDGLSGSSFEISLDGTNWNANGSISLTPTNGTLAATTISVRMKAGLIPGAAYGDQLRVRYNGGNMASISLSGSVNTITIMTVAEARAAIDQGTPYPTGVYVSGIVTRRYSDNLSNGRLSYYISDDGTQNNELEAYQGKGLNGANFTSYTDIEPGDIVVIYGDLYYHNNSSTYELNTGNYLFSWRRPVTLTVSGLSNVETFVFNAADQSMPLLEGEGSCVFDAGDEVMISVSTESSYILSTFTLNGVDHLNDIEADAYTFTINQNTTVTATAVQAYNINYSVNGVLTQAQVPGSFQLPTSANLNSDEFVFAGWTTNPNVVTGFSTAGTTVNVQGGETFYAVYGKTTADGPATTVYQKVTSEPSSWEGEYLIVSTGISGDHSFSVAFDGSKTSSSNLEAVGNYISNVVINNDQIESTQALDAATFTIAAVTGGYSIQSKSGLYIGRTANSNGINISSTNPMANTISMSPSLQIIGTGNAKLQFFANSGSERFRYYTSSQKAIQLFKKTTVTSTTTTYYTRVFINETATDDIEIVGPSIIPSGFTLDMDGNTLTNNLGVANLIIEDGGQLISGPVQATMLKHITGTDFGSQANPTNAGYYLIASPLAISPANVANMLNINDGYDLYAYDASQTEEWRNYKVADGFNLVQGQGYLYANGADATLEFAGNINTSFTGIDNLYYDASSSLGSLNLVGNPYAYTTNFSLWSVVNSAYTLVNSVNYLTLNNTGDGFFSNTVSNGQIELAPMQAVLLQATAAEELFSLYSQNPPIIDGGELDGVLNIKVTRNSEQLVDNAIVRIGEGAMLDKVRISDNATELYIKIGDNEYSIVNAQAQGEMPVSFRAAENGTYTLSVNTEGVEMDYLHLIDNMTGADVDLLATPSYTFEAKTSDYASRFRLVFSASSISEDADGDNAFAYFNGSNWTVSNPSTGSGSEATLQVVDVMGRVLSSETLSGNAEVSINQPAGVYMLRLVSGDSVKVQKVVVR